jgi:hypothetical protein
VDVGQRRKRQRREVCESAPLTGLLGGTRLVDSVRSRGHALRFVKAA